MGKEITCLKRVGVKTKTQTSSVYKPNFLKELARNWSYFDFDSVKNVTENAFILVTIRTTTSINTIVCKGFKCNGNKYSDLIKYLKKEKLIKKNEGSLKIYSMQDIAWVEEDRIDGRFNSEQHILVSINANAKKSIKKIDIA